jgi:hypothetical protein
MQRKREGSKWGRGIRMSERVLGQDGEEDGEKEKEVKPEKSKEAKNFVAISTQENDIYRAAATCLRSKCQFFR